MTKALSADEKARRAGERATTKPAAKPKTAKVAKVRAPRAPAKDISPEAKALSKKLGEKHRMLQSLRADKKAGKDVRKEIREVLKFLSENRSKKKALTA